MRSFMSLRLTSSGPGSFRGTSIFSNGYHTWPGLPGTWRITIAVGILGDVEFVYTRNRTVRVVLGTRTVEMGKFETCEIIYLTRNRRCEDILEYNDAYEPNLPELSLSLFLSMSPRITNAEVSRRLWRELGAAAEVHGRVITDSQSFDHRVWFSEPLLLAFRCWILPGSLTPAFYDKC